MKKALFAGSFDPVTNAHIDLIKRAANICDSLTVGVFDNLSKKYLFSADQRYNMVKAAVEDLSGVEVIRCGGLLVPYVLDNGYDFVVRGLRNGSDFDYELPLAQQYAFFYNGRAETVYLMSDPKLSYLSSSVVRENFVLGADVSGWVPSAVLALMQKYYKG